MANWGRGLLGLVGGAGQAAAAMGMEQIKQNHETERANALAEKQTALENLRNQNQVTAEIDKEKRAEGKYNPDYGMTGTEIQEQHRANVEAEKLKGLIASRKVPGADSANQSLATPAELGTEVVADEQAILDKAKPIKSRSLDSKEALLELKQQQLNNTAKMLESNLINATERIKLQQEKLKLEGELVEIKKKTTSAGTESKTSNKAADVVIELGKISANRDLTPAEAALLKQAEAQLKLDIPKPPAEPAKTKKPGFWEQRLTEIDSVVGKVTGKQPAAPTKGIGKNANFNTNQ